MLFFVQSLLRGSQQAIEKKHACKSEKTSSKMTSESSTAKLDAVPDVDIDDNGRFKYILIKVTDGAAFKFIVRGYGWADYHNDVFERVEPGINGLGLNTECVGGGRIIHNQEEKTLTAYGYSMGYGKADHKITVEKLKKKYPDYVKITYSNDGY